ncbi:hypothetical protein NDK43_06860 [Neobacillus pocheonensis]|uniref:YtzI protein n=1 Tax=Neobacillus pocheonensis TaxID=363869 RepID=A0ABT0W781_9BACI|nr:hypothetical protein [Neobacillus pocheonensis]
MSKLIKSPIVKIIALSMLFALMICAYAIILFYGAFPKQEEVKAEPIGYNMYVTP